MLLFMVPGLTCMLPTCQENEIKGKNAFIRQHYHAQNSDVSLPRTPLGSGGGDVWYFRLHFSSHEVYCLKSQWCCSISLWAFGVIFTQLPKYLITNYKLMLNIYTSKYMKSPTYPLTLSSIIAPLLFFSSLFHHPSNLF